MARSQRPVRVLHLIDTLACGGAEQLLLTTVRHLDPARFQSAVAVLSPPLDLQSEFEQAGIPIHHLNLSGSHDWRRGWLSLAALIRRERIDLLHTHLLYANFYGRLAGWVARVPAIVTTLHHLDYSHWTSRRLRFQFRKTVDRLAGRWLNKAHIAVSRAVRDDYVRHFGLNGIEVLYNYVDLTHFGATSPEERERARRSFGWSPQHFVLLNVARLAWDKGHRHLIEAMPEILRAIPLARLLIVGEGPNREEIGDLAKSLHCEGEVILGGKRRDIASLLGMADLFLFPSVTEGLSLASLEAMASRLPVVASHVDGIAEIIEDQVDGILIPPGDPRPIAEAVKALWRDPTRRQALGAKARSSVERRFSVAVGLPRVASIYLRALGRDAS